jgi:arabinogalactan endo-1,4-beta-galactosidase
VGNEVNGGFMWEEGRVNDNTSEKWAKFTGLLAKGIKAVREADKKIEVVIHVAGYKDAEWFYGKLGEYKIDYDIIGLSYYSWWHGSSLSDLRQTMNTISAKYGKRVIIAETAYPWTLGWNDYTNNIVGEEKQLIEGYPSDIDGQGKYIEKIIEITKGIDGSKGAGIFYWGGEYIAYRGKTATDGSTWENMALFDFGNKRLPSAGAFLK